MTKMILKKADWKKGEWHKVDVTDALCYINKRHTALCCSESGRAVQLYIKPKTQDGYYIWVPAKCLRGTLLSLTEGMEFRKTYREGLSTMKVGTVPAWQLAKILGGCVVEA